MTTAFVHDCVQAPGDFETLTVPESEDCLYLNIWKPADVTAEDRLPVLVWIHGGGFVGGGTSSPTYDGTAFARDGLVVVSFNYRLGRFGYFAHPALLAADEGPVGNFGYMDQIAALEWVHTNIAAFGGDPERVTIIGQSAGGESVLHLMCSPAVGNLFHQAMAMSGGGRHALLDRPMTGDEPSSAFYDAKFAKKQGITGNDAAALEQLRQIDPETVAGKDNVGLLGAKKMLGRSVDGVPMIDGDIVVGAPGDHFLSGDFKQVPLIIGTTAFDLPVHFPPSKLRPFAWFGDDEEAAREAYESPNRFHGPIDFMKALINISSDMTMHEDARFVSHQVAQHGLPAWLYRFTYTAESKRPGSTEQGHSGDLPFLFETLESMYDEDAITDNDRAMAKTYHSYAVNFVKSGDPNGPGLPEWPTVDVERTDLMNFDLDGAAYGPDPRPGIGLVTRAQGRDRAQG